MKALKWNHESHAYEKCDIPPKSKSYSEDMSEIVQCAQCGRELPFGETFTSMEIHTVMGFGYCVCERCYSEEWRCRGSNQLYRRK